MTEIAVLVGDRPGQVDEALLRSLLGRWAQRSAVAVSLTVVRGDSVAATLLSAAAGADGVVVDSMLAGDARVTSLSKPMVLVDLAHSVAGRPGPRLIYGRGIETYVWAARHVAAWLRWPAEVIAYAEHGDQLGELRVPAGPGPHPVVVLIHGGFWRSHWERDLMDALAIDVAEHGLAAWNIEYRRGAGSWAEATDDVACAVDRLGALGAGHRLATDQTAFVGHSAGAHLALWTAGRRHHGPATSDIVDPSVVVALAPVSNVVECARRHLGEGAAAQFLAVMPDADPERYRAIDPAQRLPSGIPTTIVQGLADGADLIDLNRTFAALAKEAGDPIELLELDGTDHFDVIDPSSDAWGRVRSLLVDHLTRR